ncbi:MAG: DNA mismatch repair protein MutS [Thermoplasmata archaeon]|nr:MAG: DNA mismatch repair protein MutS [Thermoplasmata archaeon]
MKQYNKIKSQHQDAILFFRMGDFYEMFYDDARIASKELDIVLTSRDREKGKKVPLAGFPHHAAESYIARMIKKGYKVAICEQVEDPKQAKGIVKREVVRIITPGTVLESGLLQDRANNYLASISVDFEGGKKVSRPKWSKESSDSELGSPKNIEGFGIAFVDISTGEFLTTEFSGDDAASKLLSELARFKPAECIISERHKSSEKLQRIFSEQPNMMVSNYHDDAFHYELARKRLTDHFKVVSLEGFGCEDKTMAVSAAGAVLNYLQETQKKQLDYINSLSTYTSSEYMVLDSTTMRNLELFTNIRDGKLHGTLLEVLDSTQTSMGSRMIRKWLQRPLINIIEINRRLDAVDEFARSVFLRSDLGAAFKGVQDLERLITRIVYGSANARDLVALKNSLKAVPQISDLLGGAEPPLKSDLLNELAEKLDGLPEIVKLIDDNIVDDPPVSVREGGLIKPGASEELDELKKITKDGKSWIAELEASERKRTGIKTLRVGYTKVFGYYIEVSKANLNMVPSEYIRKQTLVNAERFVTPELKDKEAMVISAKEKLEALEYKLFTELRERVGSENKRVQSTAQTIAALDTLVSLAHIAVNNNYTRPKIVEDDTISIKDGRHPVVEHLVEEGFVPNDAELDCDENQLIVLTGPNMAGKSTYMRQVALITLMAQLGSFVPAKAAQIGVVDRIFTRVGAFDDLTHGQSTFMVEMLELANILNSATTHSLIILDEIGRGTSTFDGLSIAWAVTEFISGSSGIGAKTIFATHYHQLTELEQMLPGVKNYHITVKEEEDDITFLRKIKHGGTSRSYGIQVARLAGLPKDVIKRAKRVLESIELENRILMEYTPAEGTQKSTEPGEIPRLITEPRKITQLIFDPSGEGAEKKPSEIEEDLKRADVENMTPVDAMNYLYELRKKINDKKNPKH